MKDTAAVALFRVAQAALTNVAQHAKASKVTIKIRQTQRSVHMVINDDGKSFDVENAVNDSEKARLGIIGMRERTEKVGGKFTITSSPGQGTTISVALPLKKTAP